MINTNRLIQLQRITITALLLALITTGFSVYAYRCRLHAAEALFLRKSQKQKTDLNVINGQAARLRKYEAKLNEIDPMRCLFTMSINAGVDPLDGLYAVNEAGNILGRGGIECLVINESFYVRNSDFTTSRSLLLKSNCFQLYPGYVSWGRNVRQDVDVPKGRD